MCQGKQCEQLVVQALQCKQGFSGQSLSLQKSGHCFAVTIFKHTVLLVSATAPERWYQQDWSRDGLYLQVVHAGTKSAAPGIQQSDAHFLHITLRTNA